MEKYLGVKIIHAELMSECEFISKVKNEEIQKNQDDRPGYKVTYEDEYISWSPKEVFEKAYRRIESLTFGLAIEALKQGKKVTRAGWNGKDMWLALSVGSDALLANSFWGEHNIEYAKQNGGTAKVLPTITMKTATGEILMGYLASQTDMLAEDWVVVDENYKEPMFKGFWQLLQEWVDAYETWGEKDGKAKDFYEWVLDQPTTSSE